MNNKRRDLLRLAICSLEQASEYISRALDQEQDCLDNLPENLQYSERYEKMEEIIGHLEESIENIDEAKNDITEAIS